MSHNNSTDNMANMKTRDEEKKPNAPSNLSPVSSSGEGEGTEPQETPSSRVYSHDMRGASVAWLKALSLDDGEHAGDKGSSKASTGATASGREQKASHGASTKAKSNKPESKGPKPKIPEPLGAKSCLQAMLESGMPSMHLGNVDIQEVDMKGTKNTAEILKRAIEMDTIPTDPLTREHFGFSKCDNTDGEVNLGELYEGLLSPSYLGVTTEQIHQWQTDNKLAAAILDAYYPQESGYLNWFKQNQHLVDANYVRPGGLKAPPSQGERISEDHCGRSW